MSSLLTLAVVQMNASEDVGENLSTVTDYIREAASRGATYIQTPENTAIMTTSTEAGLQAGDSSMVTDMIGTFSDLAALHRLILHIGSIWVRTEDGSRLYNRSLVFSPDGRLRATYDKIHLFDVALSAEESYNESDRFKSGYQTVVVDAGFFRLGLSICYDIRFPELFRRQAQGGASVLTAPAAFSRTTGQAHWEVLLRARAIETGSFLVAAAQTGTHADGRATFGQAMVVDPWGRVRVNAGQEPGVSVDTIDIDESDRARQRIPAIFHGLGDSGDYDPISIALSTRPRV